MSARKSLFVAGMTIILALLLGSTASAQSVKGPGETRYAIYVWDFVYQFKVNAYARNGTAGGNIQLTTTTTTYPFPDCSGLCHTTTTTTRETYSVVSLTVTGNQADVWARAQSDQTLHEFIFVDNGNGSGAPDQFGWDGLVLWPNSLALTKGNITVTP